MKILPIVVSFMTAPLLFAQQVEKATAIAPEDLGAHKWVMSATAKENEVVVFRVTTIRDWGNKETIQVFDSIRYQPNEKQSATAFFYNPEYFSPSDTKEPNWFFQAVGSTGWIPGSWKGSSSEGKKSSITFKSERQGETTKIMEVFVKPYGEMKQEYPKLPEIRKGIGWSWSDTKWVKK